MTLLMQMRQIKDLSPSERHIVDYIFEHVTDISNMGIVELGDRTFTSPTTVKRLCRRLGIDSYTDFRIKLSSELSDYSRLNILQGAQNPVGRYDSIGHILTKVSNQNAQSILMTCGLNDSYTIQKIVQEMSTAKRIDFYGMGPSHVVAVDAQIKCMRMCISSSAPGDNVSMLVNARAYTKNTLSFLISYTGKTDGIIAVAEVLQLEGVPTVSLTSCEDNPLLKLCKYNLFVDASESWNRLGGMSSRISTLNMVDILFTALINTDYDSYEACLNKTYVSSARVEAE